MNLISQIILVVLMVCSGVILGALEMPIQAIWPSIVALSVVLITRKALAGLLVGAISGVLILSKGNFWEAYLSLFSDHLAPQFESSWKMGAVGFTLLMGGFAAVLEKGTGFERILEWLLKKVKDPAKGLQLGVMGLGLACFFDGLANSMLVGRISCKLSTQCGVSREKLAYLVDSTSSAVACLAFVSTWIAYQLSMIKEGFRLIGQDVNPYPYFIQSVPFNFYCWFTLALCFVCIFRDFNLGAMRDAELSARRETSYDRNQFISQGNYGSGSVASAVVPLLVLLVGMLVTFYIVGLSNEIKAGSVGNYLPVTSEKLIIALGTSKGPYVMCLMGVIGSVVAIGLYPHSKVKKTVVDVYGSGVRSMMMPLLILFGAWMLSSTLAALHAGDFIAGLMNEAVPLWLIPLSVFITGALISFAMGSSWATMGILMPLAIPVVAAHPELADVSNITSIYAITVAAVFSGAVFGDHCSPISDTTIVSSIACEIEPHDHVRTQMPFALLAAVVASLIGFLPAGFGVAAWVSLLAGVVVFLGIGWRYHPRRSLA